MKQIILFILILLIIPIVHGVGIGTHGPMQKFVEYKAQPGGYSAQYDYSLRSNAKGRFGYSFSAEGDLAEYVTFIPDRIASIDSSRGVVHTPFRVLLNLPEKIDDPGMHTIWIQASEVAIGKTGGVSATTHVKLKILVRVLFEGFKMEARLVAPNINENETSNMKVYVDNWGTLPIKSVKAKINVFDSDKYLVGTVYTNEDDIPLREKATLDAYFDSTDLPPGNYSAQAEIYWDDGIENVTDSFVIGTKIVEVINHSDTLFLNTINPFRIKIHSKWNNPLENVRAVVRIEGKEFQTPSVNMERLGDAELEAFIDTTGMDKGKKDIEIVLYYEGDQTVYNGEVEIINRPSEEAPIAMNSLTISLILIVLLLILLNILIILYIKRKKKKEYEF